MSISELSNTPIEITLGGKTLKIQRLTIKELFTPSETKVQEEYIKNIHSIACGLQGKEKSEFLISSLATVPKGKELESLAMEYMSSPLGVAQMLLIGFNKCQPISEEEVTRLMLNSNEAELDFIRIYLSGESKEEEDKKKQLAKAQELVAVK